MIKIPNSLFKPKIQNERWGKVFIYALDSSTIGIGPEYLEDWDRIALYRKTWKVYREGSNWRLHLPEVIQRFYGFNMKETKITTSINGENILIIIRR